MKYFALSVLLVGTMGSTAVLAAVPADAPSGSMGMCKDGSYSTNPVKKGACRGHKGVKEWYGADAAADPAKAIGQSVPEQRPSSNMASAPTGKSTPAGARRNLGGSTEPAPGGGAGKVWANSSTKVYHCSGDKFYGTTKHGDYMSESDAKAKGYHADHGKACD